PHVYYRNVWEEQLRTTSTPLVPEIRALFSTLCMLKHPVFSRPLLELRAGLFVCLSRVDLHQEPRGHDGTPWLADDHRIDSDDFALNGCRHLQLGASIASFDVGERGGLDTSLQPGVEWNAVHELNAQLIELSLCHSQCENYPLLRRYRARNNHVVLLADVDVI
ncbi:hypothetical protein B484DRAFT_473266, partial [Ochromonadaceae sp. CCMP2298]